MLKFSNSSNGYQNELARFLFKNLRKKTLRLILLKKSNKKERILDKTASWKKRRQVWITKRLVKFILNSHILHGWEVVMKVTEDSPLNALEKQ